MLQLHDGNQWSGTNIFCYLNSFLGILTSQHYCQALCQIDYYLFYYNCHVTSAEHKAITEAMLSAPSNLRGKCRCVLLSSTNQIHIAVHGSSIHGYGAWEHTFLTVVSWVGVGLTYIFAKDLQHFRRMHMYMVVWKHGDNTTFWKSEWDSLSGVLGSL